MAAEWWDPEGKFKPLHMLNPCRLDYITSQVAAEYGRDLTRPRPFAGLRLLDIGCGGGLLSEPMARLGADVVGADAAERNIPVARLHAEAQGLTIDYRHTTAEALAGGGRELRRRAQHGGGRARARPARLPRAPAGDLLRVGGLMVCSTLNRNPRSYLQAIVGAEHVMRWLPKGTQMKSDMVKPIPPRAPAPATWRQSYSSDLVASPRRTASAEATRIPTGFPTTRPATIASRRRPRPSSTEASIATPALASAKSGRIR